MPIIHQLVYVSHAGFNVSDEEIRSILDVSIKNNTRDSITGLLIYSNQLFFQVLEGPLDAVESCYARVSKDDRHGAPSIMWQDDVAERSFPSWKMGYRASSNLSVGEKKAFVDIADLKSKDIKDLGSNDITAGLIKSILNSSR
jgi:hypothetical protein